MTMHQIDASVRGRLCAFAAMLCVFAALAWTPRVFAHASLINSAPKAGSLFTSLPAEARLTFNEPVSPLVLKIIQPDGAAIALEHVRTEDNRLEITLPALVQRGAYALSWRVVSADGHPIGGSVPFSVGTKGAGGAAASVAGSVHPLRNFLIWLCRLGWYVGLFAGIGLAGFHALSVGRNSSRLSHGLQASAAAATVLNVGLLGVDALDMPLYGLFNMAAWRTAASTSYGWTAVLSLAALGCAAWVWRADGLWTKRLLAGLSILTLGMAMAASGHASAAPPTWLARPAVWLHGVAVVLWIGALLPLNRALNNPPDLVALRRFSRWIPGALAVLVVSGGVLVYLQIDAVSSLWRTDYGQVLSAKLALVAMLVALGAYNRYRLTNAVLRSEAAPRRCMRKVIQMEFALALTILAVVALWRFTPPPRATGAVPPPAAAVAAHIHGDQAMVDLILAPHADGQGQQLTLYLSRPDLTPIDAQAVDIAFFNASAGIEPVAMTATPSEDGTWRVGRIDLPYQERWDVRIDILISDFDRISLDTTLERPNQSAPFSPP